jgi:hypothetical protein
LTAGNGRTGRALCSIIKRIMITRFVVFLILTFSMTTVFCQTNANYIDRQDSLKIKPTDINKTTIDSVNNITVVVKIVVDSKGNVVSAEPVPDRSTTTDQMLLGRAKEAALKAKFEKKSSTTETQTGFITYKFK